MRRLVDCPQCRRRYDASSVPPGERFRCRCGATLLVDDAVAREAAVVRCSSCGAPREQGASACRYCGSDFTVHEQDRDTMCPACHARVSDRARFCHHCAAPILADEVAGDLTERPCPVCSGASLRSRALGDEGIATLECTRCAGLWLGSEAFDRLREKALAESDPRPDPTRIRAEVASRPHTPAVPGAPVYRRCPVCGTRMNRVNYGRHSGILLDRCREHGVWFDGDELDAVLRWMRLGGERASAEREASEARETASAARFRVEPRAPEEHDPRDTGAELRGGFLVKLARILAGHADPGVW